MLQGTGMVPWSFLYCFVSSGAQYMRIVFVGDLHLRHFDKVWIGKVGCIGDISVAVDEILRVIQSYPQSYVVLCGDVFHEKQITSWQIAQIKRLLVPQAKKIFFVQGQHEISTPPILSTIDTRFQHIHRVKVQFDDFPFTLYGLDINMTPTASVENNHDSADILVTHQVWKELIPSSHTMSLEDVKNFRYVISGDYHEWFTSVRNELTFISTGSVYANSISEVDEKKLIVFDAKDGVTTVPIASRVIKHITITEQDKSVSRLKKYIDRILDTCGSLPPLIRNPIIVMIFENDKDASKIFAELYDRYAEVAHLLFRVKPQLKNVSSVNSTKKYKIVSIEDAITEKAQNDIERELAIRCWKTDNTDPLRIYMDNEE